MPVRHAEAVWSGDLKRGQGTMAFADYRGPYSFASRMESGAGTNPEELLGAAHAGCFSMAFALAISQAKGDPKRVATKAEVHFGQQADGFAISKIELTCEAEVQGITPDQFQQLAETAKKNCPVSRALAATPISLTARLVS